MHRNCWIAALCGVLALAGCDTGAVVLTAEPRDLPTSRTAVVLNAGDATLTLIPFADSTTTRTLPLGIPAPLWGSGDMEVRGERAVVGLGTWLMGVDLRAGFVERLPLPSPVTMGGLALLNDSTALVALELRDSLRVANLARGSVRSVPLAGAHPAAVRVFGGRVYVAGTAPSGGAVVDVLDAALRPVASVPLSNSQPRAMTVRGGQLLVLNGGPADAPGDAGGSLSVVDTTTLREVAHYAGFSAGPGSMALSSTGTLYVHTRGLRVSTFDFATRTVSSLPSPPVPNGVSTVVARVAADPAGAVYLLQFTRCSEPGYLVRLDAAGAAAASARTGRCSVDVEFTELPVR